MSKTIVELGDDAAVRDRFELIRRMADDLAHELKNPLNAVVINLELLRTRVRHGRVEEALQRIDVVEEELRRLHTLLDHTLRLMRHDQATDGFDAHALLAEIRLLGGVLAKLARGDLAVGEVPEDTAVRGPREPVRFALLALIEAALTAGGESGEQTRLDAEVVGDVVRLTLDAPAATRPVLERTVPIVERQLQAAAARVAGVEEGAERVRVQLTLPTNGAAGADQQSN